MPASPQARERGETEGEWALEGRTWGDPPESLVHDWHVRATLAAKELDPAVEIPKPLHPRETQHPAGQVPDKKSRWRLRRQPR